MISLRRIATARVPREAFARSETMAPSELCLDAAWEIPDGDLTTFGRLAESLYALARRVALDTLQRDDRLDAFGFGEERWAMRRSAARGDRPLLARADFALLPVPGRANCYTPWMMEINGDTPGLLLEGSLEQTEWGRAMNRPTAGDRIEEMIARSLSSLPGPGPLCFLHHPGDPYIVAQCKYFASLVPGSQRYEYPAVPAPHHTGPVYKMYRWGRLWDGAFPEVGRWLQKREERNVFEPAWAVLLQHKGLLATLWDVAPGTPGLLPATLLGPQALPDGGASGWAHKSFHGIAGAEVLVAAPGQHVDPMPSGGVWQARVPPLQVAGLYPVLCAVLVQGRFAGALMREDVQPVSGSKDELIAPLAVVPDTSGWSESSTGTVGR